MAQQCEQILVTYILTKTTKRSTLRTQNSHRKTHSKMNRLTHVFYLCLLLVFWSAVHATPLQERAPQQPPEPAPPCAPVSTCTFVTGKAQNNVTPTFDGAITFVETKGSLAINGFLQIIGVGAGPNPLGFDIHVAPCTSADPNQQGDPATIDLDGLVTFGSAFAGNSKDLSPTPVTTVAAVNATRSELYMVKPVRQQDLDFMKVEHGWWEAEKIAQTHQRVQEAIKRAEQEFVEQEKQGWEEGQRLYVQLQRNRAEQIAELEYMRSHKFNKRQQMVDAYCQKFDQQLDKVLETFTSAYEVNVLCTFVLMSCNPLSLSYSHLESFTSSSPPLQAEERKIAAAREAAEHARREEEAKKAAAAAAEIRRKAEEEKKRAAEAARKEAEAKQKALQLKMEQLQQQQQKQAEASVSEEVLKKEKEYKDFIKKCKNDLKNDPKLNAERSTIKQHFTLRLNQLTNKKDHIMTTANELSAQLTGAGMSTEQHYYRLNMLAKTIVDQIGITVLDRPEMAFAFGHLCILLYSKYAEFRKFVDARLAKKCPYVLPRYYDRSQGQSADEYDKLIGRQSNETEEVYRKRMLAYVRFHLAVLQTKPWIPNIPYQKLIEEAWIWIAEILNLKQRSITPAILDVFIEVVAHRFYEAFQRDGLKILNTIYRRYYVEDTEELKQLKKLVPGDVAVLQNRLQECFSKQTFAEPQGRTPL
ncbi:9919_t:CDS:2 [Paraglomus occultum]|uniref:mRNA export factor GLE1 n=1 Tax=Paraglomus occultum TaxID=144539 RepID=A0A9N8WPW2_9GLOM|nr:9919_t:CDS:2 [Paraglomus occultum]